LILKLLDLTEIWSFAFLKHLSDRELEFNNGQHSTPTQYYSGVEFSLL